jgi:hypothetical protein
MPSKTLATVAVTFKNPSPEKLDAAAKAAYDGFMRSSRSTQSNRSRSKSDGVAWRLTCSRRRCRGETAPAP